jgi:hypothetical protein
MTRFLSAETIEMRTITLRCAAIAFTIVLCAAARPAAAGVIIDINQVGADVVATGSGSVDLAGLTFSFSAADAAGVSGIAGGVAMGPAVFTPDDIYVGVTGPTSFGPGGLAHATSGFGDVFGVNGTFAVVGVPLGYVSGTPLSASDTYAGQTLGSLGLTAGTYTFTFGIGDHTDSIVVNIGASNVPEPSSLSVLGVGGVIAGILTITRKRRAARANAAKA